MGGIKRTTADKHFSDAIRGASDFICQRCQIDMKHNMGGIDCSHIVTRKFRGVRWDTLNALCLCRSCHTKMADDPPGHAELVKKIKGEEGYWELIRRKNQTVKIPKSEEKEIGKHYLSEVKRIQAKRNEGCMGYVEVNNWMDK